jgi:hypothetical protein
MPHQTPILALQIIGAELLPSLRANLSSLLKKDPEYRGWT